MFKIKAWMMVTAFMALLLALIFSWLWYFGGVLLDAVFEDAFYAYTDTRYAGTEPTPEPSPDAKQKLPEVTPKRNFTPEEMKKVRRSVSPFDKIGAGAKAFGLLPLDDILYILGMVPGGLTAGDKQEAANIMLGSFLNPSGLYEPFIKQWKVLETTEPSPAPSPSP